MVNGAGWHALRAAEGRGASRRVARPESSKGVARAAGWHALRAAEGRGRKEPLTWLTAQGGTP